MIAFLRWLFGITREELLRDAVIEELARGELSGRELRRLVNERYRIRLVPFYYLMMQMGDDGLVTYRDVPKLVGGHTIKERRYQLP